MPIVPSPPLLHALVCCCEEDVRGLPGGLEHDLNDLPCDASASVLQTAQQSPEARFPWHETRLRVSEQLFVVFADGVGHRDGRDVGAHVSGWSREGLFWWQWEELGLCC